MIHSLAWYANWAKNAAIAESEGKFKYADKMTQNAMEALANEHTPEDREAASIAWDDAYRANRRATDARLSKNPTRRERLRVGDWVHAVTPGGGIVQGRVERVVNKGARPTIFVNGSRIPVAWVQQRMGSMTRSAGGVVRQNPTKGKAMKRKTTKAPSAAQLAARERFAAMARAGKFKKAAKRAAPKKRVPVYTNPAPTKAPPFRFPWLVETQYKGKWGTRSAFASKDAAVQYAQALADASDKSVRVRKAGT